MASFPVKHELDADQKENLTHVNVPKHTTMRAGQAGGTQAYGELWRPSKQ